MNAYNLFDEFLDGVFIFNEAKEVLYCSEIAATVLGTRPKRVLGKKSFEIFKIKDESLFCTESGTKGKDDTSHYIKVAYEGKNTNEQATTDIMTGLKNFREFNLKVAEEIKKGCRIELTLHQYPTKSSPPLF